MTRAPRAGGSTADAHPLTSLQQGMLAHALRAPGSGVDIEQIVVTLPDGADAAAMAAAWRRLVAHHDVLRTSLAWDGLDQPEQRTQPDAPLEVASVDWRGLSDADQIGRAHV